MQFLSDCGNACLIFNLNVNWSCLLQSGLCVYLVLGNSSVHCIVHHASLIYALPVYKWILIRIWPVGSIAITKWLLSILSYLWWLISILLLICLVLWTSLRHNAATNNAESTWVLACPCLLWLRILVLTLLNCVEVVLVSLDWTAVVHLRYLSVRPKSHVQHTAAWVLVDAGRGSHCLFGGRWHVCVLTKSWSKLTLSLVLRSYIASLFNEIVILLHCQGLNLSVLRWLLSI